LAQEAAREVWSSVRMLRRKAHESIQVHGDPYRSSNPLTLFGEWGSPRAVEFWTKAPGRMTPAQMLGALLAMHVIVVSFPEVLLHKLLEEMQATDTPTSNDLE
jgi:hypothetical protein